MANTVSQQAAINVQATEKLLGVPEPMQVTQMQIEALPDLPSVIPGANLSNVAEKLQGQPSKDLFEKSK